MRFTLAFILLIIFAVGLVAVGFTFFQSSTEKTKLQGELEIKTAQVAGEIFRHDSSFFEKITRKNIEQLADSLNNRYNLRGCAVYYYYDSILSSNSASRLVEYSRGDIARSITADTTFGKYFKGEGEKLYQYIEPVKRINKSMYAVVLYTDARYIDKAVATILSLIHI